MADDHKTQRTPSWRETPAKFAVHLLRLDVPKALEVADLIMTGFFVICEGTNEPFEKVVEQPNAAVFERVFREGCRDQTARSRIGAIENE